MKQICRTAINTVIKVIYNFTYLVPSTSVDAELSTANDIENIHIDETCSSDYLLAVELSGCQEQNGSL